MSPAIQSNPDRTSLFSLSRQHSAFSATILLSLSSLLSAILGLLRVKFIAHVFGAGHTTDAYNAAFQLPDMISYFLVGGVASITLVSILNRFREAGDEDGADRALSVVLVGMVAVLGAAIVLAELLAPLYTRTFFGGFDPETRALCTHLTRLLLPAQLCFFAGGVLGSRLLVRKIFLYQAVTPLVYNSGILLGGILLAGRIGIDSLAWGVLGGALLGSDRPQRHRRPPLRPPLPPRPQPSPSRLRRVGQALAAPHGRRLARHGRQVDPQPLRLRRQGRHHTRSTTPKPSSPPP